MKIAIFTNNYLPNPYGVAGSVESFHKEFERLGHEVYIFASRWRGYMDKNPRVFRYPAIGIKLKKIKYPVPIPYSSKINKILDNLKLDIIHSQHPNLLGSAAMKWAKKKKIPLVFTWHTLYDQYAHFVPFVPPKIAAWWAIRNARKYADKCDQVIVPTPSIIDILKNWGVTNKNIIAIPTGVEEKDFSNPDREKIRNENGVKDNEILLALISRLTEEKNVGFLFEAVMEVLRRNDNVKFMVCGEGSLRGRLGEIAAREGLEEKVIDIGNIERQQLKDYYSAGDIFVYTSKSETQGMVFTEAMYSGLPIVAVRATGVKDIVEDNKTGFLVREDTREFGKAVQKLIDDEDLRKNFGEEAKIIAREKYTSSVCGEKMIKVYGQAIEAKNIA